jgi:cell division septum initiation protein DivIVA
MRKDKVISSVIGEEMAVSPSDLYHHQSGRQIFGGYRRAEVDTLLEKTADALEALVEQVRTLKADNQSLEANLEDHRQMEATLRSALVSSQKFSEEIVESARREATAIISEAEARRSEVHLDAAKIPESLAEEIQTLQEHRQHLRRELTAVLEAHRYLLDNFLPGNDNEQPQSIVEVGQNGLEATPSGDGESIVEDSNASAAGSNGTALRAIEEVKEKDE